MAKKTVLRLLVCVLPFFLFSCARWDNISDISDLKLSAAIERKDTKFEILPSEFHELVGEIPGGKGIITLTGSIHYMPESSPGRSGLYLGRISFADEVFINGEFIGRTGRFPPNWFNDWNKERLYLIPNSVFNGSGAQELTIRIYAETEGHIRGKWFIGPEDDITAYYQFRKFLNSDLNLIIALMFILFGCYNLLIFVKRRSDEEFLWLGLLTLFFALNHMSLIISSLPLFNYRLFSSLLTMKLTAILELLIAFFALNFLNAFMRISLNGKLRIVSLSVPLLLLVASLLQEGYGPFKQMLGIFEFSLLLPAILFLIGINRRQGYRTKNLKVVGYAAVPALLSLFHDLTLPHILDGYPVFIGGYGFSVFLIILNIYLALDFVNDRNRVEILNKNLEAEIESRSRELLAANEKVAALTRKELFVGQYDLSGREREILMLILDGMTNDEIADRLSIAIKTVNAHLYNLYRKLGIHSRVEIFGLFSSS